MEWAMSQSVAVADRSNMVSAASASSPMVVAMFDEMRELKQALVESEASKAALTERLAIVEDKLEDYRTRNHALTESLQVAQALQLGSPVGGPCQRSSSEGTEIAELKSQVKALEAKLARVEPPSEADPAVSMWLDEIQAGFGARFAKAFRQAGYEDFQDITSIPPRCADQDVGQIMQHLRLVGAKPPQERRIRHAVTELLRTAGAQPSSLAASSAAVAPDMVAPCMTIEEWLDQIHDGFGARFAPAFTRQGYESVRDLAEARLGDAAVESVFFHLNTMGARQPQQRQIREAMRSLALAASSTAASAGSPAAAVARSGADDKEDEALRLAIAASLQSAPNVDDSRSGLEAACS